MTLHARYALQLDKNTTYVQLLTRVHDTYWRSILSDLKIKMYIYSRKLEILGKVR